MILCNESNWVDITSLCVTIVGLGLSVIAIIFSYKSNKLALKAFDTSSKIEINSIRNQYFEALKSIFATLRMTVLSYDTEKTKINSKEYLALVKEIDSKTTSALLLVQNYSIVYKKDNLHNDFSPKVANSWAQNFCNLTEDIKSFTIGSNKDNCSEEEMLNRIDDLTNKFVLLLKDGIK